MTREELVQTATASPRAPTAMCGPDPPLPETFIGAVQVPLAGRIALLTVESVSSFQTATALPRGSTAIRERRYRGQTQYIDMLLANGPLRSGLTPRDAADTYAALANPESYAFLTGERGWSPERFEHWLADSLTRLLLP
ncbi:MAG TPA: hypothetical protein VGR11_12555 [Solirubrobacteraceae bacterium]|nr:hypothetical protein [Solirubrobacteraceae bacterium]